MKTIEQEVKRLEREQGRFSTRYAWWFVGWLSGIATVIGYGWLT